MAQIGIKIQGHLKIREFQTIQDYEKQKNFTVLLNQRNAVHKDNAAIFIALALTNRLNAAISYMVFGNGGATFNGDGSITAKPPNVTETANLYNPTFFKLVDDRLGATPGNSMAVRHISASQFTDADIRCLIWSNEPFGQVARDEGGNLMARPFVFNEIGLKTNDGRLITHVTFTPVLKNAASILEIIYTLRVAISQPVAENADVRLIGVEAESEVGSVGPVESRLLVGVEATSHVGEFVPVDTGLLVGVEATSHVATIRDRELIPLAGVSTTAAVGTVSPAVTVIVPTLLYFEATLVHGAAGVTPCIGIGGAGFNLSDPWQLDVSGGPTNSDGMWWGLSVTGGTPGQARGGAFAAPSTPNIGDVVGIAIDLANKKAWLRNATQNTDLWSGPATTAQVISGIHGSTFDPFAPDPITGNIYILIGAAMEFDSSTAPIVTLNTGASPFAAAPPTGWVAWDDTGATTINPFDKDIHIDLSGGDLTLTMHVIEPGYPGNQPSWFSRSNTSKAQQ